jgi:hypothetical protein
VRAPSGQRQQPAGGCGASIIFRSFAGQQVDERELPVRVKKWRRASLGNEALVYNKTKLVGGLARARIDVVQDSGDTGSTCKNDAPDQERAARDSHRRTFLVPA